MLLKILQIMHAGHIRSLRQLAKQLDVSEALLEEMIDQLVRMGYLRPVKADCLGVCSSCPESSSCNADGSARLWALTEAGANIVQSGLS